MIHLIGTNAGLVWRALHKGGRMSIRDIKKETKIRKEKDVYAAIGWLAKEEKINLSEQEGETCIWLVE
ncbi:MAG: winged helix-turn-helix domain-containing protein [Tannerella sp.]|jgi:hypothetical protein|nr:winged helix-turn-helix domain-containing protein [Tannerella sp.]